MHRLRVLVGILCGSLALAACGGDDETAPGGGAGNGGSPAGAGGAGGDGGGAGTVGTGGGGQGDAGGSSPDASVDADDSGGEDASGEGGDRSDVDFGGEADSNFDADGRGDAITEGGAHDGSLDGGSSQPKACASQCAADEDCLVNESNVGYACQPERKRCEKQGEACQIDDECMALASFWTKACTTDTDCLGACVDAGGFGRCATKPKATGIRCLVGEPLTRPRFGVDGGTVEVCGSTAGRCQRNRCIIGCTGDSDCGMGAGNKCNTQSGLCECMASLECTASGVSTCNPTTHHCECSRKADCTLPGQDVCVQGVCGCSSAGACTTRFGNATPVCD